MEDNPRSVAHRLAESELRRSDMRRKFGIIPLSVLRLPRELAAWKHIYHYGRELGSTTTRGKRADTLGGDFQRDRAFRLSGGGSRSTTGRAFSIMPPELVAFFARYYNDPTDNVVYLDPFMGQGVQMQVAHTLGMIYYGYDASEQFCSYIATVRAKLDTQRTPIIDICGDSRNPSAIPDDIGEFCFTSPPYWDTEFYGDEESQLGSSESYPDFLDGLEDVARAFRPKFKAGATIVVNVNDFRKQGTFYPFHADTISAFVRAGYTLTDTWILDALVSRIAIVFAQDHNRKRVAPKVHEYALVFRV